MNGTWESDIKNKTKDYSIRKEQLTRTHAGERSGNVPVEILLMPLVSLWMMVKISTVL